MDFLCQKTDLGWIAAAWGGCGVTALILPRNTIAKAYEELADTARQPLKRGEYPGLSGLLQRYFAGEELEFGLPLDLSWSTPFQEKVYRVTCTIPWGEARSYGWIADAVGSPGAARAVGSALARNRIPLLVPCHRILRRHGGLGGFSGGKGLKEKLLSIEGIEFCEADRKKHKVGMLQRITDGHFSVS